MLLAFSMLGLFVLNLLGIGTQSYIQDLQSLQAFYLAEGARNYYLEYYLPWENDYSQIGNINKNLGVGKGGGTFSIAHSPASERSATVTFTGSAGSISRKISIDFSDDNTSINHVRPRDLKNFCLYSGYNTGETEIGSSSYGKLKGNVFINGNTKMSDGDIGQGAGTNYTYKDLYANGTARMTGDQYSGGTIFGKFYYASGTPTGNPPGVIVETPPGFALLSTAPFPIPQKPDIDTSYFDKEIAVASTMPVSSYYTSSTVNLNGRNIYVNGNVNIRHTVNGPGSIVATGVITVENYPYNGKVGERVNLIAEDYIQVGVGGSYADVGGTWNTAGSYMEGKGALLYAKGDTSVINKIDLYIYARVKGVLLTPSGTGDRVIRIVSPIDSRSTVHYGVIYGQSIPNSGSSYNTLLYGHAFVDKFYPIAVQKISSFIIEQKSNNDADNDSTGSMKIPIKIRGLYSPSGTWKETF